MGQQHSRNEPSFHREINRYNIEGIKTLHREGANIELRDSKGRTPLTLACLNPDLYMVAKTLIELGANVNACDSGGTPLHHAAKKGHNRVVQLLLSHGANAFISNVYSQTPLGVARESRYNKVVRTIENSVSLFSGWMRKELSGYHSSELMVSEKVWVVVTPCGSLNHTSSSELELAVYSSLQDARPKLILALGKAHIEEPNFHHTDPAVILIYLPTNEPLVFGPAKVGDKQQLELFCNSCKGIRQTMHPTLTCSVQPPPVIASAPPAPPEFDLHIPMNDMHAHPLSSVYKNCSSSSWASDEAGPSTLPTDLYPPIYSSSMDILDVPSKLMPTLASDVKKQIIEKESSCTICENAPVEGACVPCGHMAGCMKCLNNIKMMNSGCPFCRSKISQVVRLFAV